MAITHTKTIERLRKQASAVEKQRRAKTVQFIRWEDLEEKNFLLFDLSEGYFSEKPQDNYKFLNWRTPAYILIDDGGAVITHSILDDDAPDEEFYEMPCTKYLRGKLQEALDKGHTTAYMTGYEYVEGWTPKNSKRPRDFNKVELVTYPRGSEEEDLLWTWTSHTNAPKKKNKDKRR